MVWVIDSVPSLGGSVYPLFGAGLHFVIKPEQHNVENIEYAQGVEDNRGVLLKLGYAW